MTKLLHMLLLAHAVCLTAAVSNAAEPVAGHAFSVADYATAGIDLPASGEHPVWFEAAIPLDGELIRFQFTRRSQRSAGFAVHVVGTTGVREHTEPIPVTTYAGVVRGVGSGPGGYSARASLLDDGLYAIIRGPDERTWGVQPLSGADADAERETHVVYRGSDVLEPEGHRCACDGCVADEPVQPEVSLVLRSPSTCRAVCEIAYEADFAFFERNNSSVADTVADIEMINNLVNGVFEDQVSIRHTISSVLVIEESSANPYAATTALGLLGEMNTRWNSTLDHVQRDVAHLMTGVDLDGGFIGFAYIGVICDSSGDVGVSESLYSTNITRRRNLTAHELGHNWDCQHDNELTPPCDPGFIMNPGINTADSFSTCSVGAIQAHRDSRVCLDVEALNVSPVAVADTLDASSQGTGSLDVLANDADAAGCAVTVVIPSTTDQGGALSILPDGSGFGRDRVSYTPPSPPPIADSFSYELVGTAGTSSTTVDLNIVPAIQPASVDPATLLRGLARDVYDTGTALSSVEQIPQTDPIRSDASTLLVYRETTGDMFGVGLTDGFAADFHGYFRATQAGEHRFSISSDDGADLSIGDGAFLLDNDGVHLSTRVEGTAYLDAGYHPMRIRYFDQLGPSELRVRVATPADILAGSPESDIPAQVLFYKPPCQEDANQDGVVSVGDILDFLAAWAEQEPPGDWDGDGIYAVGDILSFLARWSNSSCG